MTCRRCFRTLELASGSYTAGFFPMEMRRVGADRQYYMMGDGGTGDMHIWNFDEPDLLSCNTALGSLNAPAASTDMGLFPTTYASNSLYAGQANTFTTGFRYDDTTGRFYQMWGVNYSGTSTLGFNSFAAATWNGSAFSLVGCWSLGDAYPQGAAQNGLIDIPSWFTDTYLSAGQRLAIGLGGGRAGQHPNEASYGPFAHAIASPSGNACNTDNPINDSTELANHIWAPSANYSSGPTCSIEDNQGTTTIYESDNLRCTPAQGPYSLTGSTPQPARTSFSEYSSIASSADWDPWMGEGFFGDSIYAANSDWFDNGTKHAYLSLMGAVSGSMHSTVAASPAPTFSGTTYTFAPVAGVSANNGYNVQVGSMMWVQTCTPGVEMGCSTNNGNHVTIVQVTNVNAGTGVITAEHYNPDGTGAGATPVVGGEVWLGSVYVHGIPMPSQLDYYRLQFRNPDHFGEVIGTTRKAWNIPYQEDIALTDIKQFGCPDPSLCASAISPGVAQDAEAPLNIFADNVGDQIILIIRYKNSPTTFRALGVVYDVN
jgi:hypothetical protein